MTRSRSDILLFAYFKRPRKEYLEILESINASGGLSNEEVERVRQKPSFTLRPFSATLRRRYNNSNCYTPSHKY
jgi:hypothetical protein